MCCFLSLRRRRKLLKYRSVFSAYNAYRANILIVADTEEGGQALGDILGADFSVVRTKSGKEGLTVLKKDEAQIDLILVDLETAAMSFSTFLRMKADAPKMCRIPAVVVLTENSEENKNAVLRTPSCGQISCMRHARSCQKTAGQRKCRLWVDEKSGEEKYENDLS